ncbi:hypothetical protein OHX15_09370, partial [Mycolicibacterium parafortuitum]|nr:hypothetical protein [Mycolicibacterium parafortuitum]
GWSTRMNERGEVEWIPPPPLDTGQTRINTYHRPERLLRPPDQEPTCSPDAGLQSDGGAAESTPSSHHDQPGETPRVDDEPSSPGDPGEPDKPDESSNSGQPGGPAPPDGQAA